MLREQIRDLRAENNDLTMRLSMFFLFPSLLLFSLFAQSNISLQEAH